MNKTNALKFCEHWLAAWTGNQPEKLIHFYADEIYYRDPAKQQGIQGKSALLHYFRKLLAKYPHWIWQATEVFPTTNGFILKWQASLSPERTTDSFHGMDIVVVSEGKITRNEVYFDPAPLL